MGLPARRLRVVLLGVAVVLSLFGGRLLQLQGFDVNAYAERASHRLTQTQVLYPIRGTITDRNGAVLAASEPGVNITADPTLTKDRAGEIADIVKAHLGGSRTAYLKALTTDHKADGKAILFAYVAKRVPATTYDQISADLSAHKIVGIYRESAPMRNDPGGTLAAQVIGSVGADGVGLTGFEYTMNDELAGTPGKETYEASTGGSKIPLGASKVVPAVNGVNYRLTIDSELQWLTEKQLAARTVEVNAKHGIAIAIDIKTGQILAMASTPGYDANSVGTATADGIANHAISDAYEPGSVEKILTYAAAIDAGVATPDTQLTVPGKIKSGDGYLHDYWSHGTLKLTARGAFAKSSNIGTAMVARQLETAKFRAYLASFGLGQATGVELPGEATGYLPPPDMPDYAKDQIAFGQGLSVSALQEAAAVAGILNGGVYNPPTIIASATDSDGNPVEVRQPASRRVVSEATSKAIASMMESVTAPGGTASNLGIKGYRTGGKTGTAQRINPETHTYEGGGNVMSFIAMAPAQDPRVLTYVVMDRPDLSWGGGTSAGPVAMQMLQFALTRFGVWPTDEPLPRAGQLTW